MNCLRNSFAKIFKKKKRGGGGKPLCGGVLERLFPAVSIIADYYRGDMIWRWEVWPSVAA